MEVVRAARARTPPSAPCRCPGRCRPATWPSTSVGLIARPTSCAATIRRTRDGAELDVDLDQRDLRAEPVRLVRDALAVGVEDASSSGRTCPTPAARSRAHPPAARAARGSRRTSPSRTRSRPSPAPGAATSMTAVSDASASSRMRRRSASPASRAALPETNVWRDADVLPASGVRSVSGAVSASARDRHAERVGGDLRDDGRGALADVGRPREQPDGAVAARSPCRRSTGWAATCCRCRTTSPRCRRRAGAGRRRRGRAPLNASASARSAPSAARARRGTRASPALAASTWPVAVVEPGAQRVPAPDLELVDAELRGQVVDQRLVGDRRLGHPEAAERAGRRAVRVDRRASCRRPRHGVRARSRGPARGWRPSAPTTRRRRCRSRRGTGRR